jgi:stalled ribosome rescue protein Dom34
MSADYYAVVWIDHHEAKIFHCGADAQGVTIRSGHPHQHLHHKANSIGSGHAPVEHAFLERVSQALSSAGAILITGPAGAKHELAAHIARGYPDLAARISAVEALDHPTDGQLLALARKFFRADDRMHPQGHRPAGSGGA